MVTQLTLMVLGGLWLGKQMDQRLDSEPLGLMFGVFLGFGLGMWRLIRQVSPPDVRMDHDPDA